MSADETISAARVMSDWTQDHYVTRNSTTDDPSGYRVWLTCRCGWDSGTLVDGNLPTTHRAELEHYVSVAPLAEVRRQAAEEAWDQAMMFIYANAWVDLDPGKGPIENPYRKEQ